MFSDPHTLQASVFGYDDILRVLHPFLRQWHPARATHPELRPYIVSADIAKAFDSVSIPKLLSIVEPLLASPQYMLLRYCECTPALGAVRTRHQAAAFAGSQATFPGFPQWVKGTCKSSCNAVFVDQIPYRSISHCDAMGLLREHVTRNMLCIGKKWYIQGCGIAQGSVASTLLCSLYLADLESKHLHPVLPMHDLCMPGSSSGAGKLTALADAAATRTTANGVSPVGSVPGQRLESSSIQAAGRVVGGNSVSPPSNTKPGVPEQAPNTVSVAGTEPRHQQGVALSNSNHRASDDKSAEFELLNVDGSHQHQATGSKGVQEPAQDLNDIDNTGGLQQQDVQQVIAQHQGHVAAVHQPDGQRQQQQQQLQLLPPPDQLVLPQNGHFLKQQQQPTGHHRPHHQQPRQQPQRPPQQPSQPQSQQQEQQLEKDWWELLQELDQHTPHPQASPGHQAAGDISTDIVTDTGLQQPVAQHASHLHQSSTAYNDQLHIRLAQPASNSQLGGRTGHDMHMTQPITQATHTAGVPSTNAVLADQVFLQNSSTSAVNQAQAGKQPHATPHQPARESLSYHVSPADSAAVRSCSAKGSTNPSTATASTDDPERLPPQPASRCVQQSIGSMNLASQQAAGSGQGAGVAGHRYAAVTNIQQQLHAVQHVLQDQVHSMAENIPKALEQGHPQQQQPLQQPHFNVESNDSQHLPQQQQPGSPALELSPHEVAVDSQTPLPFKGRLSQERYEQHESVNRKDWQAGAQGRRQQLVAGATATHRDSYKQHKSWMSQDGNDGAVKVLQTPEVHHVTNQRQEASCLLPHEQGPAGSGAAAAVVQDTAAVTPVPPEPSAAALCYVHGHDVLTSPNSDVMTTITTAAVGHNSIGEGTPASAVMSSASGSWPVLELQLSQGVSHPLHQEEEHHDRWDSGQSAGPGDQTGQIGGQPGQTGDQTGQTGGQTGQTGGQTAGNGTSITSSPVPTEVISITASVAGEGRQSFADTSSCSISLVSTVPIAASLPACGDGTPDTVDVMQLTDSDSQRTITVSHPAMMSGVSGSGQLCSTLPCSVATSPGDTVAVDMSMSYENSCLIDQNSKQPPMTRLGSMQPDSQTHMCADSRMQVPPAMAATTPHNTRVSQHNGSQQQHSEEAKAATQHTLPQCGNRVCSENLAEHAQQQQTSADQPASQQLQQHVDMQAPNQSPLIPTAKQQQPAVPPSHQRHVSSSQMQQEQSASARQVPQQVPQAAHFNPPSTSQTTPVTPVHATPAPPDGGPRRQRQAQSVLLRLVDDFLFVTSSKAAAEAVTLRLHQGFPDYNCSINPAKTRVNFPMALPGGVVLPPQEWRSRDG